MSVGVQSDKWREQRDLKSLEWFLGNRQAYEFVNAIMEALEFTDDLVDQDVDISNDRIVRNLMSVIITLPNNDFFIMNRAYITPILIMTVSSWLDSEKLKESDDERHKMLAFHLRNLGLELYHATAFLVGGFDHLRKVGVEMREFFALETYEEWLNA